jgi:TonB family protein
MAALRCAIAALLGVAAACALFAALVAATARPECDGCEVYPGAAVRVHRASEPRGTGERPWWGFIGCGCCWTPPPTPPAFLTRPRMPRAHFDPPGFEIRRAAYSPALDRDLAAGVDGERCGNAGAYASRSEVEWPASAARSGVRSGSVLVAFDVSARGGPENLRVVESRPKGVFDDEALRAVSRWHYCPQIRDGQPVSRDGLFVRIRFER